MTHATPTARPDLTGYTPEQVRIAELSDEFIFADKERRTEIGQEISGIIKGRVKVLPQRDRVASFPLPPLPWAEL